MISKVRAKRLATYFSSIETRERGLHPYEHLEKIIGVKDKASSGMSLSGELKDG